MGLLFVLAALRILLQKVSVDWVNMLLLYEWRNSDHLIANNEGLVFNLISTTAFWPFRNVKIIIWVLTTARKVGWVVSIVISSFFDFILIKFRNGSHLFVFGLVSSSVWTLSVENVTFISPKGPKAFRGLSSRTSLKRLFPNEIIPWRNSLQKGISVIIPFTLDLGESNFHQFLTLISRILFCVLFLDRTLNTKKNPIFFRTPISGSETCIKQRLIGKMTLFSSS